MRVPERNPLEFVLAAIVVLSVWQAALGLVPLPGSLQSAPDRFGQTAAAAILIGSVGVTAGLLWRNRDDGLIVEQFGCILLAAGCLFYGTALGVASDWNVNVRLVMGMTIGIGAGFAARVAQIQRYVRWWKRHGGRGDTR